MTSILVLFALLISSCDDSVKSDESEEAITSSHDEEQKTSEEKILIETKLENQVSCGGLEQGSLIEVFTFTSGNRIKTCGYPLLIDQYDNNRKIYSEFDLIACGESEKVILSTYADEFVKLDFKNDTLSVAYLKAFPLLYQCEDKRFRQVAKQEIFFDHDSIVVTEVFPYFEHVNLDYNLSIKFVQSIYLNSIPQDECECVILTLEFLALNGNENVYQTLLKFEEIYDGQIDGAIAETIADARANVEWHFAP